jgi:hypothetical protein
MSRLTVLMQLRKNVVIPNRAEGPVRNLLFVK